MTPEESKIGCSAFSLRSASDSIEGFREFSEQAVYQNPISGVSDKPQRAQQHFSIR